MPSKQLSRNSAVHYPDGALLLRFLFREILRRLPGNVGDTQEPLASVSGCSPPPPTVGTSGSHTTGPENDVFPTPSRRLEALPNFG